MFFILFLGSYSKVNDTLRNQDTFYENVNSLFSAIDSLKISSPRKCLGYGRTGNVLLADVWCSKNPGKIFQVALKMADLWKDPGLEKEMMNETRVRCST